MKKYKFLISLSIVAALGLAGCGKDDSAKVEAKVDDTNIKVEVKKDDVPTRTKEYYLEHLDEAKEKQKWCRETTNDKFESKDYLECRYSHKAITEVQNKDKGGVEFTF